MNFTQNDKINQVTNKTLVIGMDIAKLIHYACMVDERGLLLKKSFPVHQSRQVFEFFYEQNSRGDEGIREDRCHYWHRTHRPLLAQFSVLSR